MDTNTLVFYLAIAVLVTIALVLAMVKRVGVHAKHGKTELKLDPGRPGAPTTSGTSDAAIKATNVKAGKDVSARDRTGQGIHVDGVDAGENVRLETVQDPRAR